MSPLSSLVEVSRRRRPGGGGASHHGARAMFSSLSMRASTFTTSSLTMASSSNYSKGASRQRACVTPRARLDAGVGAFGSKAGMTQVFTEDGLCVPVTVIAVREGNVVTQVRIRGNFFLCVRARAVAVASVSLDPTADSFIRARVGWVTRRDATSVGETATVMDVERGEGRRGRRWRENAPFRSFVRSFVRATRARGRRERARGCLEEGLSP